MELILGNYYDNIKCESFRDKRSGRIRIRPLKGQGLPTNLLIECDKRERERHPVGTVFITENVKVCVKPNGRFYLRAKDQYIEKLI